MSTVSNMSELDRFLLGSWGRCPATGADPNLPLSRLCPLANDVYRLLGQPTHTPSFICRDHNKGTCPLADRIQELALEESYRRDSPQTRQEVLDLVHCYSTEVQDFVSRWLDDVRDECIPYVGRMVVETMRATNSDESYRKFMRTIPHDNQCVLYSLLRTNSF